MLDVARLNQGVFLIHPESMNLVDLAQEMALVFNGPEHPIEVQAPQEVILSADPDRIRQVIQNLLANAIQYAPEHTSITMQIDTERRKDGVWTLLTVSNAGTSIPPKLRAQLFQPFVGGVKSGGLGLGLYVANGIAMAHCGSLSIDSPQGQGVQTTLSLPIENKNVRKHMPRQEVALSARRVFFSV
jgi:signal transduction histidine kinase